MVVNAGNLKAACLCGWLLIANQCFGQVDSHGRVDLSGDWILESYEEDGGIGVAGERGGGFSPGLGTQALGNYLGLPLNDAGRQRAISWDPSAATAMKAMQVRGPTLPLYLRSTRRLSFQKVLDKHGSSPIAYKVIGGASATDRTIWLDGRAVPPEYTAHTWAGFSRGLWEEGVLVVKTTNLMDGALRGNHAPCSRNAVLTEYYIRRGNRMTLVLFVEDPAYLDEPYVVTSDYIRAADSPPTQRSSKYWDTAEELDWPEGYLPSYPLGWHHTDVADLLGIPLEATEGGKETLYPQYRLQMMHRREVEVR